MRYPLLLLPLVLSLTSCATMVSGTQEHILVSSSPGGAAVVMKCADGTTRDGVTPFTLTFPRKTGDCTLALSKDGYGTETLTLEQGINGAYWRNFITAPLVPVGVAGFTGFGFSEADTQSREWGAVCLLTTAAAWSIDLFDGAAHGHGPSAIDVVLKPK
jgi:hypothetical protein